MDRWKRHWPLLVLVAATALYITVASSLSLLRCEELYCRNWDLGIFQQSLWSTTHGRILWEAGDYETFGVSSFFQVHPSLVMFPLATLYSLAPTSATLLLFQAVVTGLAAIPLYLVSRNVVGSPRLALLPPLLYLAWAPVLSANLYDFHLESLLPLEFFTFYYLWLTRRYPLAVGVGMVANLTLEIAPVLLLFILLFLCRTPLQQALRGTVRGGFRHFIRAWKGWSGEVRRSIVWGALLGILSVATYVALRLAEGPYISLILGSTPPRTVDWGFTPASVHLSLSNLVGGTGPTVAYWGLLYLLVGLLPLRRPSTLIMVLPWMLVTFFSPYGNMVHLGYSYGYIAAVPLFLGVPYGVPWIERYLGRLEARLSSRDRLTMPGLRSIPHLPLIAVFSLLLLVNLTLSPVDPAMQLHGGPGATLPGYWVSYSAPPGFSAVQHLAEIVPSGAFLLASDNLFPLVANDVNAYAAPSEPGPVLLPFNATHLPEYVFVAQDEFASLPLFVQEALSAPGTYREVGLAFDSNVGTVGLYQHAGG